MVRARKRFGQHFLEPVWAEKVVEAIEPRPGDRFVEIGPGHGILTLRLAPRVERLIAVEIDRDLVARLTPQLPSNASVVCADVLTVDLATLVAGLAEPVRIAGNLPYNISSPVMFKVLEFATRQAFSDATFMLQREVAARIAAHPGSKDYGVLSILVQWRADVSRLFDLPPGAFRPPPAVRSSLIRLRFRPARPTVKDPGLFEKLVRTIFMKRRKTLRNALDEVATTAGASAGAVLSEAGIDGRRRPETLEIVEIARLADLLSTAGK